MKRKYLFSPVGNTDPIKYFRDGSLLHICRHYKPDVVYLYMSKEMLENHKKDNRYVKALELLGEKIQHTFEIHIIGNSEMIEVQQYDVFYNEFRKIIQKIEAEKEKKDLLLVNMASGTPAMKSALVVMATLAEYRFLPIQVSSPKKKSNLEYEERADYDTKTNFELDEDNEDGEENRCEEVKCMNLMLLLKKDMIKKHLLSYNYQAALEVGKSIREDLTPVIYRWLEAARARSMLDWETMNKVLPKNNGLLEPVEEENLNKILLEYTLTLDLKLKRGEYADFVRAITPLGVDMLEMVLKQYCGIEIQKYYLPNKQKEKARKWDLGKMEKAKLDQMAKGNYLTFNGGVVYSTHLNNIIQRCCADEGVKNSVDRFSDVESKVRNIAAHNIVSVTPEWIEKRAGETPIEIMECIKYICEKVEINTKKAEWDSYDRMNRLIIRGLELN